MSIDIINSLMNIKERIGRDPTLLMYHKISTSSAIILFHKINDLLDYTLWEQGKLKLEACEFDPRQVIIEVLEAFEYQIRLKQLNL